MPRTIPYGGAAAAFGPASPRSVDDAAIDFVFSAHVRSADNLYTLPFRFNRDGIFRDRASVLIGRNGVGKTQLLEGNRRRAAFQP